MITPITSTMPVKALVDEKERAGFPDLPVQEFVY